MAYEILHLGDLCQRAGIIPSRTFELTIKAEACARCYEKTETARKG
jgi:hypothetical protein